MPVPKMTLRAVAKLAKKRRVPQTKGNEYTRGWNDHIDMLLHDLGQLAKEGENK